MRYVPDPAIRHQVRQALERRFGLDIPRALTARCEANRLQQVAQNLPGRLGATLPTSPILYGLRSSPR